MAFDITGLSAYVELKSKEIAMKAVADAKTAKILIESNNVQLGVKGSAKILKADSDVIFQDNSDCGRTALGNTKLSDKTITVKPIADFQDFCPKKLYNTYYAFMLNSGQMPESELLPSFVNYIMQLRSEKINAEVDKLLWIGDTSIAGSSNMKRIDGILKQIVAGDYIDTNDGGSTVIEKLQKSYLRIPNEISSKPDFRIFIGEDLFSQYLIELANRNIYRVQDDYTLFGTNSKLEPVHGLSSTNKSVMTRLSNLQLGLDGSDETDKAELRYSNETKKLYQDFQFAVGIAVVNEDEVGYANYSVAPTTTTTTTLP